MAHGTLIVSEENAVLSVTLNRPDVHNAFNDELIAEAIEVFGGIEASTHLRAVVLRSGGANFCAGADLSWMSRMVSYTRDENIRDSSLLAKMYALIDRCPIPVIGRIQGAAIGGGVGLVAVCDIAIAVRASKFGLSEVRLGILPAVISPYVIGKIGASHSRALFLTGERFDGERALRIGLVHRLVDDEAALDPAIADTVTQLASSGPEAVKACKELIAFVSTNELQESIPYTIEAIAERRVSEEGQGGMQAFLKKTNAPWIR
jgi:methylglutaconyl-CoA hydratase